MSFKFVALFLTLQILIFSVIGYPFENDLPPVPGQVIQNDNEVLSYRLPNNTKPETYDISLQTWIHEGNFTFTGQVMIGILTSNEPGENITLHHRQLTIKDVELWDSSPGKVEIKDLDFIKEREFFVINLVSPMKSNTRYTLVVQYTGTLRGDLGGFYRSSYVNEAGVQKWLATTQFESTNARHAFPCYDETALKANFTIRITHDPSYSAISNMPEKSSNENPDGTVTTEFLPTPPTSTYLIAFVVSDFEYTTNVKAIQDDGVFPHRVFAKPTHVNQTYLTLDAGVKILQGIADYVNVPFTLPKMDQIAVPDFAPGAMENWGLVTYKESRLFWDESKSTYTTKSSIISVIAHEFGHQWFGNLVGPRWWTYLWLNEGFATLFEYIGTDLMYPEWGYLDYMVLSAVQGAFLSDELSRTSPMTNYVSNPDAMPGDHGNVAYRKSGSVLRMFLHAFTEDSFKKGLNYYLNAKSFSDAAEEDLFEALEKAVKEDGTLSSPIDVSTIMASWTRQSGFPIVQVQRNYENGTIQLTQKRYLTDSSEESSESWFIPYNFLTASDSNRVISTFADDWLPKNLPALYIEPNDKRGWSSDDWIIFNINQTGYYRVQYDERNYELIAKELEKNPTRIPYLSRAQMIDDAFSFANNNQINYTIALSLAKYLHQETGYIPWGSAIKGFSQINRLLRGNENYTYYLEYLQNITEPIYKHLGIDDKPNEPHFDKYLRNIAITWACLSGSENCISDSMKALETNIEFDKDFHQNVKSAVYCAGLRNASTTTFANVHGRFNQSTDLDHRGIIISALGCTMNADNIHALLFSCLPSTNNYTIVYKASEAQLVLRSVYENTQLGLQLSIEFIKTNIDEVYRTFGSNGLEVILNDFSNNINSNDLGDEFTELIEKVKSKSYVKEDVLQKALAKYKQNMDWLDRNADPIFKWLHPADSGANAIVSSVFLMISALIIFFE